MASAFSHAFVALAGGKLYPAPPQPWRFFSACVILSILPDLDVIGFAFGIPYEDTFGHRGFTHSIAFALLAGAAALPFFERRSWSLWLTFSMITASHGILDALTDGGLGIAFFSPFSNARYFFPWTPVRVSPIGIRDFFTGEGVDVLRSELLWIWAPAALISAAVQLVLARKRRREPAAPPN